MYSMKAEFRNLFSTQNESTPIFIQREEIQEKKIGNAGFPTAQMTSNEVSQHPLKNFISVQSS
jgi:hypothetical protein